MADKKSRLELATEVFDGWEYVPVEAPIKEQVSSEEFVAVKGNPEFYVPRDSFFWSIEYGYTCWIESYNKYRNPDLSDRKMFAGSVYAVRKSWYEQNK